MSDSRSELESAIAVVGRAIRAPGARSVSEFWMNVRNGVESLAPLSDEALRTLGVPEHDLTDPEYVKVAGVLPGMDEFDAAFFGMSPREAAIMDPQHRHFLECAWEALEDAGHVPHGFAGSIGVFGGSGMNAYLPYNLLTNPELVESYGLFLIRHTGNDKDFLTTRASYQFDLRGPSVNVQTACSTSLVAIHLAVQSLLNGECDLALAGGVSIELPHGVGYRCQPGGILSPDGHCRPFDAESKGTVFGSGVGVVVLRRLAEALADGDVVHAIIRGSAANNDGSLKVGYLAPSVDGQAAAVSEALSMAGVSPDKISYIETHGTGTPVGDPIEVAALTQAFRAGTARNGFCAIGSVKSNIGHLDTAAGVASFIKVVEALEHRELPPTLHFTKPNPEIRFEATPFVVNDRLRAWPAVDGGPRVAAVSSLGVGGTNAHVILQEAPRPTASGPARRRQLLILSGRTPQAVKASARRMAEYLGTRPEVNLADVAFTLQNGREPFACRAAVVCEDVADAASALESMPPTRVRNGVAASSGRSPVFMFAGGGAQYDGMGRELYDQEPVYREHIETCLGRMPLAIRDAVRGVLCGRAPGDPAVDLSRPSLALPALFTTQYAHARLLMTWGIRPAAMIGHSMGEYTAACLSGVLSLDDALALVSLRGRLFERLAPGAMLSVPLPAGEVARQIGSDLAIAAINAPELCVVSGRVPAIDRLQQDLAAAGTQAHRLHIAVASHSPMVEPILQEFGEYLRTVRFGEIAIPFVSNRSGTWAVDDDVRDPDYWVQHLRQTVRFADGIATLAAESDHVLLEVGPGRTLATLARLHPSRQSDQPVLSSMPHPDEPVPADTYNLDAVARLWTAGVDVDWKGLSAHETRRRVSLPTYPFESRRHWIAPGATLTAGSSQTAVKSDTVPPRQSDLSAWGYQHAWSPEPLTPGENPAGTVVVLADPEGLADQLAARLTDVGRDVVVVRAADGFQRIDERAYDIRPLEADDYRRIMTDLRASGRSVRDVVHLLNVSASGPTAGEARDRAFNSLMAFARACDQIDRTSPVSLTVIANGTQEVAGEGLPHPLKALLLGPCSVIPAECEGVTTRAIDVVLAPTESWQREHLIDQLANELQHAAANQVLAYRGEERFVRRTMPRLLPAAAAPRLRQRGTYLITGGTGGLGLALARRLGTGYQARIALVGRTPVPARAAWDQWIGTHRLDDRVRAIIETIKAIESAGGEVLPLDGDVTSLDGATSAVARTLDRWGELHGVVHAAGVLQDSLIAFKSDVTAHAVLAPKVEGTLALDRALEGHRLDFLCLYSSVSAFVGLPGQIDYAAASAFLDAFARDRTSRTGEWTIAIDWSPWQQIGMAAELARGPAAERGVPAGHPLLDVVRGSADDEQFTTEFSVGRHWLLDEHRLASGQALIPGAGYVELARAALATRPESRPIEFRNLFFLTPFTVADDEHKTLRLTLDRKAGEFTIASQAQANGAWLEHVQGSVRYVDSAPTSTVNLARLRDRCAARVEAVTEAVNREHLRLGPRWRNLHRIESGAGEALLTLELDPAFAGEAAEYAIHPALFDVATAGVPQLIEGFTPETDFYVPVSYQRILAHAALPARIFSHVRHRHADGPSEFAVFDITIYDERGVEIIDIDEFTMKRIDASALAPAPQHGVRTFAEPAGPLPAPRSRVEDMLDQALPPDQGLEMFERILAGPRVPHVIVSPADLEAWRQWMRRPLAPPATGGDAGVPEAMVVSSDIEQVEAVLCEHPAVREAAAAEVMDLDGQRRMLAYVVYDRDHSVTVSELRRHVRARVAEPLVPTHVLELPALPRLADGAVDRTLLPNPFAPEDDYTAPATATGQVIAEIWRELLGIARVSAHDNFFNVGGHSLLSVHALARIQRRLGVSLQHADIVVNTLDQLAAKCERLAARRTDAAAAGPTQESA